MTNYILMLVLGLAIGAVAVWLIDRARRQQAVDKVRAESEAERAALLERIQGKDVQLQERDAALAKLNDELQSLRAENVDHQKAVSALRVELEQEKKQTEAQLALLEQARQKLADAFKALASDALNSNSESFLRLAKATLEKAQETAKGDLEARQTAVQDLVRPVRESLDKVDAQIRTIEVARQGAYKSLEAQIDGLIRTQNQLRSETSNLVTALRSPVVRGRWGEIQLKRVVEMAGMVNYCDFEEQPSVGSDQGRLRPDLIVRLPGDKTIVVDAKAPLEAYLDSLQAETDDKRKERLRDHARQIRAHAKALGGKAYWEQFPAAPEFVVLFLPGETFFSAALEQDPGLIEFGVEQRVILATPTTLIALLRAVAYGWRQESIARSAHDISELGKELYKRLCDLGGHIEKVGRSLESAIEAYNRAVGTLESRVLVSARKFRDLEAAPIGAELDEIKPIDHSARALQSPELLAPSNPPPDSHDSYPNNKGV